MNYQDIIILVIVLLVVIGVILYLLIPAIVHRGEPHQCKNCPVNTPRKAKRLVKDYKAVKNSEENK
jgi:competence protein ComGC